MQLSESAERCNPVQLAPTLLQLVALESNPQRCDGTKCKAQGFDVLLDGGEEGI